MIEVDFEIKVGDSPRKRTGYLVITGKGAYGFDQLLRATGFAEAADKIQDPNLSAADKAFDSDQLLGQELNVVVDSDTYQGNLRDKIRSYLKA